MLVKWPGGKKRLLPKLLPLLPDLKGANYFEPFLGGGSMFFSLCQGGLVDPGNAYLSDVNAELINMYVEVACNTQKVMLHLAGHAFAHNKEYYYQQRAIQWGRDTAADAARFIYLNKTCFNGLYRVNASGQFNVPMGKYASPRILDTPSIQKAAPLLHQADIAVRSIVDLPNFLAVGGGDFCYLDPPYPGGFTSYTRAGFDNSMHMAVRDVCDALSEDGTNFMLSYPDTPDVRKWYKAYDIRAISAPRSIAASGTKRAPVGEVVILNYTPAAEKANAA